MESEVNPTAGAATADNKCSVCGKPAHVCLGQGGVPTWVCDDHISQPTSGKQEQWTVIARTNVCDLFIGDASYRFDQSRLPQIRAIADAHNASITAEREKADKEMERVKACEHIAEGDEGWEQLSNLCPSTAAVAKLRTDFQQLDEQLATEREAQSQR